MDDDTTMRMMADRNPQQLNAILQEVAAEQEHRKGNNAKVIEGQEYFVAHAEENTFLFQNKGAIAEELLNYTFSEND